MHNLIRIKIVVQVLMYLADVRVVIIRTEYISYNKKYLFLVV